MSQLGELFGGATKGTMLQALALSNTPLTCYRIARAYNLNIPKVYVTMKKLAALGVVVQSRSKGRTEYFLADDDLRKAVLKFAPRVISYEAWSSREARKMRFRAGLQSVPSLLLEVTSTKVGAKPTRLPGELENLALLARRKFDSKYRKTGVCSYVRV